LILWLAPVVGVIESFSIFLWADYSLHELSVLFFFCYYALAVRASLGTARRWRVTAILLECSGSVLRSIIVAYFGGFGVSPSFENASLDEFWNHTASGFFLIRDEARPALG